MPRRRWDDPWHRYEASVPLPAEGGIATSKQRGAMAETWWSQRFVQVLESYGLGARMQRGRRYARTGQVLSLEVSPGILAAQVQGSRRTPYLVTIASTEPAAEQWHDIEAAMAAKIGFVARLLAGDVPPELEDVFLASGVPLFPVSYSQLRSRCSCPDPENPCKHLAAVLYVFADLLDADPWLVLAWRGRTRDELLGSVEGADADAVAPWWPFAPGVLPDLPARPVGPVIAPDEAALVLDALDPLAVAIASAPFVDLLRPAYEIIVEDGRPELEA